MINKIASLVVALIFLPHTAFTQNRVEILNMEGDVKIRRGLDEQWQQAQQGMLLEEIDTILTGDDGSAVLRLKNGSMFKLSQNSTVDINDLREITEKELFLFLMSDKIKKIEMDSQKTPLRIGNVSVVHGEDKAMPESKTEGSRNTQMFVQEKNGAKAMFEQNYYSNTIVKLHKILSKYAPVDDGGEIYFYLGKSFEAIHKNGQACDAYQTVIDILKDQNMNGSDSHKWIIKAQEAINRLRQ